MLATGIAEVEQQILIETPGPIVLSQMEFAETIEEKPSNSYRSQVQPGCLVWSGNSFGVLVFWRRYSADESDLGGTSDTVVRVHPELHDSRASLACQTEGSLAA